MNRRTKLVLSASRRSDIPAFYMPWFMRRIDIGHFEVANPYNRRVSIVPATTDRVGAIVFWSKNFGPFLENDWGGRLRANGHHLFFNFTINSPHPVLEPGVPALPERLDQLKSLCRRFGADAVLWRMDPICVFRSPGGGPEDNLDAVYRLADAAAACGVGYCVTSFLDIYAKVLRRAAADGRIRFVDPPPAEKVARLLRLEKILAERGIRLHACCERETVAALPPESTVTSSACISNARLLSLYDTCLSTARDRGQRTAAGCGCQVSVDVGSYDRHPCYHNCLFCYANPRAPKGGGKLHGSRR